MKRSLFTMLFLLNACLLFATAKESAFKEYGIRGVVDQEFSIEDSYDMASAIVTFFREKDEAVKTIAVGADGRVHSPAIKAQVCKALSDRGFNIVDIGTCTTPVMSFCLHTEPVDGGIMITASHNPGEYNGMKISLGTETIYGQELKRVGDIYFSRQFLPLSEKSSTYQEVNMNDRYVHYFLNHFPHLIALDIHAIIDCGNGAAGTVLPELVKKMQWNNVKLLYPEVDGTYPNHIADPTVEKYMEDLKAAVLNSDAELGLGLDGDCDRMAPMTKQGRLVTGDQLLTLYSKQILQQFPGHPIVFDVSSSLVLHRLIKEWGGIPVVSATGFPHVKKKMKEVGSCLGGEISCHTIFNDRYFGYDDGIYSIMRLFELLITSDQSLEDWISELPKAYSSPLYRIPCDRSLCFKIVENLKEIFNKREDAEIFTVDGIRVHLPYGWAIVRASNTEPVISIRLEGNTEEDLSRLKKEFYEMLIPHFDCSGILK